MWRHTTLFGSAMKVKIKTLKAETFIVDVEATDTVRAVKRAIENCPGAPEYPCDMQQLIFKGTILEDNALLSSLRIVDGDLLVLLKKRTIPQVPSNNYQNNFYQYFLGEYWCTKSVCRLIPSPTNIQPKTTFSVNTLCNYTSHSDTCIYLNEVKHLSHCT